MKAKTIKFTALLATVALSLTLLSGCGKQPQEPDKPKDAAVGYGNYKMSETLLKVPEYAISRKYQRITANGLFYEGSMYDEETGLDRYELCVLDTETGENKVVYQPESGLPTYTVDRDGSIWLVLRAMGSVPSLLHIDQNGKTLHEFTLIVPEGERSPIISDIQPVGDKLVLITVRETTDADGVLQDEYALEVVDMAGKVLFRKTATDLGGRLPWGLIRLSDDRVGVCGNMVDNRAENGIFPLDIENQSFGERISYQEADPENSSASLYESDGEYLFLKEEDDVVYGYRADTAKYEALITWAKYDFYWDANGARTLRMLKDGTLLVSDENEVASYRLTPCDASEVAKKTTLTLAGLSIDEAFIKEVHDFNRTSKNCRIEVKDYAGGEEGSPNRLDNAAMKLNTEIMAGDLPDMLLVSQRVSHTALAKKGALVDLYPYLDKSSLGRDSFVNGMLAAQEIDGKLYAIATNFELQTAAADSRVVGSNPGLTLSRLDSLQATNAGKTLFQYDLMQENLMGHLSYTAFSDYVDWSNGTCRFTNPSFARLLEMAKALPNFEKVLHLSTSSEWVAKADVDELAVGDILLEYTNLCAADDYKRLLTRLDSNVNLIGMPTENGTGTLLKTNGAIAITNKCADKEGAWAFIQRDLELCAITHPSFSTNRASFEAELAQSELTDAQQKTLLDTIAKAKPSSNYDWEINSIIKDEASYFFAGKCSAQDAAKKIQERVSIYVNEQN